MKKKNHIDTNTRAGKVFDVVNVVFMIVMIFITLYPLYYVLVCSVSDPKLLLAHEGPLAWWLGDFTLEGYQLAMNNPNILLGFGNTMFNLVVGTLANMLLTVLAVIALYYAVGHWNSWFPSMVFIRNTKLYTLQYVLRGRLITNSTSVASGDNVLSVQEISFASELVKYCTIVISTLPIMCVYPFLTKYFEKGVMIGAVKG